MFFKVDVIPVITICDVSIAIYDTKGRLILDKKEYANVGFNQFNFDLYKISKGMYLINLTDGTNSISRPILIR